MIVCSIHILANLNESADYSKSKRGARVISVITHHVPIIYTPPHGMQTRRPPLP